MNAGRALFICAIAAHPMPDLSAEPQPLLVTEIFHSLQGETSLSGIPFAFIRLTGCNLRCSYCDSAYAFKGGKKMRKEEILQLIKPFGVRHALLTGGEPLLQRDSPALVEALTAAGYQVSIETHGEVSIERVSGKARIVMDIKTPSSGMCRGGFLENFRWLRPGDEVKFVIGSKGDYAWARNLVLHGEIPAGEILFSPVVVAQGAPSRHDAMDPTWLAEQILKDRLNVRMQLQLHKLLWGHDRKGV